MSPPDHGIRRRWRSALSPFAYFNSALSPGGQCGRLTIMIFHRVLHDPDPLLPFEVDARTFERRMRSLSGWFNVIPLGEAVVRLRERSLPPRALCITFDDGYADNYEVALPILARLGLPATFFIATGYLDGGCMWNDKVIESVRQFPGNALDLSNAGLDVCRTGSNFERIETIEHLLGRLKYERHDVRETIADAIAHAAGVTVPSHLMMSRAQLRKLVDAGMSIGAHTVRHPILSRLDLSDAFEEIRSSKAFLEALIEQHIMSFAYPNGKPGKDYTSEHVDQVRALGFAAACSTATGCATYESDVLQLPRFTPWDRQNWKFAARLTHNLFRSSADIA
jgi:peptidoglycan/xylan/chitin deacetylase (PgdA/CDA1 family)